MYFRHGTISNFKDLLLTIGFVIAPMELPDNGLDSTLLTKNMIYSPLFDYIYNRILIKLKLAFSLLLLQHCTSQKTNQ